MKVTILLLSSWQCPRLTSKLALQARAGLMSNAGSPVGREVLWLKPSNAESRSRKESVRLGPIPQPLAELCCGTRTSRIEMYHPGRAWPVGKADTTSMQCHVLIVPAFQGAWEPGEGAALGVGVGVGVGVWGSAGSFLCQAGPRKLSHGSHRKSAHALPLYLSSPHTHPRTNPGSPKKLNHSLIQQLSLEH